MSATIILYTNCLLPKELLSKTIERAIKAAKKINGELIISSHVPVLTRNVVHLDEEFSSALLTREEDDKQLDDFLNTIDPIDVPEDENITNLCTGRLQYCSESILTQIIYAIALSRDDLDKVILHEHDVFYPENYFEDAVKALDQSEYAIYYDHIFADDEGFFKPGIHFWHLSRYSGRKNIIRDHFSKKISTGNYDILEPVPDGYQSGEEIDSDIITNYKIFNGSPVVDFRHGANSSGQILVDKHFDNDPYWGDVEAFKRLITSDSDYAYFLNSRPEVGYGLFTKPMDMW